MGSESSDRRQRNIAGWRQSFRELCCSSSNTKQAAEESIKPPQSNVDGQESDEARLQGTLAKWHALLVDIKNEKDELSAQPKRRFQWKHNKRLHQLEGEMARVLELIKRSEQEILSATVNDRESIKAQLRGWLVELQAQLVDIKNEKDELSARPKRRFQWKHNKRLHQLEEEMARVSERKEMFSDFIQKFEQHMSRRYPSASATVNNTQSEGLELPADGVFCISKSVKRAACQMLVALEDQEVHLIGLVGVRGVGKTALAKLVARKAQRSRLFDLVLMIDSHSWERFEPDRDKIWHQMAVLLGVEDTPKSAKSILNKKLDEGKKMLIILDDVWWKKPDLEALEGIPYGQRCKILVITCLPQVCADIGCHATIQLNGLTIQEAREWYEHINVSHYLLCLLLDLPDKVNAAKRKLENWEKEIVGAYQGLPLSFVTIGEKLMKQESDNFSTQNLVRCINEHVFNYLKLHYDYLSDQESKSFFILCSHFPEDYCPTFEQLTRYVYGALQKSFQSAGSIHEARIKIHGLISNLQSYSLLEVHKDHKDQVVKMPDLFRRLAHWIAEQDGQKILAGSNSNDFLGIFPSLSTACISNRQLKDILGHDVLECTKLEIKEEEEVKDPVTYLTLVFRRMKKLKVLFLSDRTSSVETRKCLSLEGLQHLTDLRTLQLQGYKLKDLPSLGKLSNLEILCFISCEIDEPPDVLGELCSLKLLELSSVNLPALVSLDWIGKLSKLEELHMTDVSIKVPDMISSINLKVKHLELNDVEGYRILFPNFSKQGLNQLEVLKLQRCSYLECLVDATKLKEVQEDMEGCSIETTNQMKPILGFPNLTNLELRNLDVMSCLCKGEAHISLEKLKVIVINSCGLHEYLFPTYVVEGLNELEMLHIFHCEKLKSIFKEDPVVKSLCLPKLMALKIESCSRLEYVFPDSMAKGLPQLGELEIKRCTALQHVFMCNEEASNLQTHAFVLPALKRLCFDGLPALRRIRKGADTLEAPLEELDVTSCTELEPFVIALKKDDHDHPRLKRLNLEFCGKQNLEEESYSALREKSESLSRFMVISSTELFDHEGDPYLSSLKHLRLGEGLKLTALWRGNGQVIGMQNLAHLELHRVNLRYVFTPTSVRNIPQLKHLRITSCNGLEHIIEDDQPSGLITAETRTQYRPAYFPNLAEIEIKKCRQLKSVFPVSLVQFPKLKSFIVENSTSLTQIFTDQEVDAGVKHYQSSKLEFPRVRKLSLVRLSSLVCFAPVGYHCVFPSLSSLRIEACPKNNTRIMPDELSRCFYGKTEALPHLAASSSTPVMDTAQPLNLLQFSGQDYDVWSVTMKTFLVSQDLWEIVEKGVGRSSSNEDKKKDAQALSIIQQSLTKKELYQMIVGANSARKAWDILREKYQGDRQYNKKTKASSTFIRYVNVLDRLEELFADESGNSQVSISKCMHNIIYKPLS